MMLCGPYPATLDPGREMVRLDTDKGRRRWSVAVRTMTIVALKFTLIEV